MVLFFKKELLSLLWQDNPRPPNERFVADIAFALGVVGGLCPAEPGDHLGREFGRQVAFGRDLADRVEAADYPQGECNIRDEALIRRAGVILP